MRVEWCCTRGEEEEFWGDVGERIKKFSYLKTFSTYKPGIMVVHTYNPSYLEGVGRQKAVCRLDPGKNGRPYSKSN
jgi:hypothetical protein